MTSVFCERSIFEKYSDYLDQIIHCDFSSVNEVLEEERRKSMMFLTNSLSND